MAFAASVPNTRTSSAPAVRPKKPGLFARLSRTLQESRRRRAEEMVGRYIDVHGGRVTDSLERAIERRFREP